MYLAAEWQLYSVAHCVLFRSSHAYSFSAFHQGTLHIGMYITNAIYLRPQLLILTIASPAIVNLKGQ